MTQTLISAHQPLYPNIILPDYKGRQMYMHTFDPYNVGPTMAEGYEDYSGVVALLCELAGVDAEEAHLTVDEKIVQPGFSQRRPGAHVDGCYLKEPEMWGHPSPVPPPGMWAHYCNNLPMERMAVIVASSVPGCMVYPGIFKGDPENDGDCEHLRPQFGESLLLPANQGFLLSPDCVHESMIFDEPTQRTFMRIAFAV